MLEMVGAQNDRQFAPYQKPEWKWINSAGSLLYLVLAVLQLAVGIGLIGRRAWTRGAALTWAWLKIVAVVLILIPPYQMEKEAFEAMQPQGRGGGSAAMGYAELGLTIGICLALAWGWALPVFMLIWLNRGSIKEQVEGWRQAPQFPPMR